MEERKSKKRLKIKLFQKKSDIRRCVMKKMFTFIMNDFIETFESLNSFFGCLHVQICKCEHKPNQLLADKNVSIKSNIIKVNNCFIIDLRMSLFQKTIILCYMTTVMIFSNLLCYSNIISRKC